MPDRVEQWRAVLDRAIAQEPVPGGVALTFANDPDTMVELARLSAAEITCCAFFSFVLKLDRAGVTLEVRAPAEAAHILAVVLGTPTGPTT